MADLFGTPEPAPARPPGAPREPPAWEPMTEEDRRMARRLARCTFPVASWDKRFVREVAAAAQAPEAKITPKMRAQLERLTHRYRRQLGGQARC
jgi:hypothetical protein